MEKDWPNLLIFYGDILPNCPDDLFLFNPELNKNAEIDINYSKFKSTAESNVQKYKFC